jgi:hypothetical protein
MTVAGAGIPANSTVVSIDSPTSITISTYATASGSSLLTFGPCGMPESVVFSFDRPVSWPSPSNLTDLTMIRNDAGKIASATSATQFSGDSSFTIVNDYYNGKTLRFTSGNLNGESHPILDYDGSSRTFCFSSAFSAAPNLNSDFQIDSVTETGTVASVVSETQFSGNSTFSTIDDYYIGRRLTFTSGVLNGQSSRILDYTGATRTFTFQPDSFTAPPSVNDSFKIDVNRIPAATIATLESASDPSQWLLNVFLNITLTSGRYTLAVNGVNTIRSLAANVAAGAAGPSVWTQTDGAYQNGGKAEGPGGTPGFPYDGTPGLYYDVTGDGYIAPNDVLTIINKINSSGSGPASTYCAGAGIQCNPPYYDANNDGYIAPNDSLIVINYDNIYHSIPTAAFGPGEPGGTSPPPDLQPTDVVANVQLQVTNLSGAPITSINVGQQFQLRALLVLTAPDGLQAFAGYADVQFSSLLVSPTANAADVGFGIGSSVSNGLINEAGHIMYPDASGLMFSKTFTATKKGTATFTAEAADLFGHEIYVTGLNDALPLSQITFGSTTLTIKP